MIAAKTEIFSLTEQKNLLTSWMQVLGGSLLLALCSQISIPLYFTPVPLSAQTLGIMLLGATLGSRKAFFAVLAYLVEGVLGLPVFAGGSFGLAKLLGPTGGYLIGFAAQAYLVGWFCEKQTQFQGFKTLIALFLASFVQMGLGVLWLSFSVGLTSALMLGFYPFLLGDAIKVFAITAYLKNRGA